jgi:hypothetical protein
MAFFLLDAVILASFIKRDKCGEISYDVGLLYQKEVSLFKLPVNIANFCFPEKFNNHLESTKIYDDTFVFCLTDAYDVRFHCFCMRFKPPNDRPPENLCIVTKFFWKDVMNTILMMFHSHYAHSPLFSSPEQPSFESIEYIFLPTLNSVNEISHNFPAQGELFNLNIPRPDYDGLNKMLQSSKPELDDTKEDDDIIDPLTKLLILSTSKSLLENSALTLSLRRPYDPMCLSHISLHCDISTLFQYLSPSDVVSLHQWLLLERSTIVVGSSLPDVSYFCYSLISIFVPFSYTGVFIPVLPYALSGFLSMPYPFLIGVQAEVFISYL